MAQDDARIDLFLEWANRRHLPGRLADCRRVARDLFERAGDGNPEERHVDELVGTYRKSFVAAQIILLVPELGELVREWARAHPQAARRPRESPAAAAPPAATSPVPRDRAPASPGDRAPASPRDSGEPSPRDSLFDADQMGLAQLEDEDPPRDSLFGNDQVGLAQVDDETAERISHEISSNKASARGSGSPRERGGSGRPSPPPPTEVTDKTSPSTPSASIETEDVSGHRASFEALKARRRAEPSESPAPVGPREGDPIPPEETSKEPAAAPSAAALAPAGRLLGVEPPAPSAPAAGVLIEASFLGSGFLRLVAGAVTALFLGSLVLWMLWPNDAELVSGAFKSDHVGLQIVLEGDWLYDDSLEDDEDIGDWDRKTTVLYRGDSPLQYTAKLSLVILEKEKGTVTDADVRTVGASETASGNRTVKDHYCSDRVDPVHPNAWACRGEMMGGAGRLYELYEAYWPEATRIVFVRMMFLSEHGEHTSTERIALDANGQPTLMVGGSHAMDASTMVSSVTSYEP